MFAHILLIVLVLVLYAAHRRALRPYMYSHFGVLSPVAVRVALQRLRGPRHVIAVDVRKMHDLNSNEVFGYDGAQEVVGELMRALSMVRTRSGRAVDVAGQYGGDEFIYALDAACSAEGFVGRMQQKAAELTARMTPKQRQALCERTGGLVDGIHLAIAVRCNATDISAAVKEVMDEANRIKSQGATTGNRSTSGAAGTLVAYL